MKKCFLVLICALCTNALYGQTSKPDAEAMARIMGEEKKAAMANLVAVSGNDSVKFWEVYDEYEKQNVELAKSRLQLYEKIVRLYGKMDTYIADSIAQLYFDNRVIQENNLQDYYKKMKAATNSIIAFEFYQAEVFLLTEIRGMIMQKLPTYGEYVKSTQTK